jgi:hypothetical protein
MASRVGEGIGIEGEHGKGTKNHEYWTSEIPSEAMMKSGGADGPPATRTLCSSSSDKSIRIEVNIVIAHSPVPLEDQANVDTDACVHRHVKSWPYILRRLYVGETASSSMDAEVMLTATDDSDGEHHFNSSLF